MIDVLIISYVFMIYIHQVILEFLFNYCYNDMLRHSPAVRSCQRFVGNGDMFDL